MKVAIALLLICLSTLESHQINLEMQAAVYDPVATKAKIGTSFLKQGVAYSYDSFANVKVITAYFTASWCSPCQSFTPVLANFYNQVNAGAFVYENVANLYEYTQAEYDAYAAKMPWALIPNNQYTLYYSYGVSSIPTLSILNKDGTENNRNGRSDVTNKGVAAFDQWAATVGGYTYVPPTKTTTTTTTTSVNSASTTAFAESNNFRKTQGKVDLVWDDLLFQLCSDHNTYQIAQGTISHDGFADRCYKIPGWQSCAENVAYNYDDANPGATVVNQWINSSGHRANLLSDNKYMGVSGVKDAGTGRWYFCQFFANHS